MVFYYFAEFELDCLWNTTIYIKRLGKTVPDFLRKRRWTAYCQTHLNCIVAKTIW